MICICLLLTYPLTDPPLSSSRLPHGYKTPSHAASLPQHNQNPPDPPSHSLLVRSQLEFVSSFFLQHILFISVAGVLAAFCLALFGHFQQHVHPSHRTILGVPVPLLPPCRRPLCSTSTTRPFSPGEDRLRWIRLCFTFQGPGTTRDLRSKTSPPRFWLFKLESSLAMMSVDGKEILWHHDRIAF